MAIERLQKGLDMKRFLILVIAALLQLTCSQSVEAPRERAFNLSLRYGVGAKNELNTFNDTFTKDLILDGTVTTRLVLAQPDFDSIKARLLAIDIFSYPDTFVAAQVDTTIVAISPLPEYLLTMKLDGKAKEVFWLEPAITSDPRAVRLREVFSFIRQLIESKPEFKQLPDARGGYI